MTSPSLDACRREIERLHDLFVAWYTGETDDFEGMEGVIESDFEMVSPDGDRVDREAVLRMVREAHGEYAPGGFDIDIRNVEAVDIGDDYAVVRYEEWQTSPAEENGRLSTVLFHTDTKTPNGLSWSTVHETWLDEGQQES